MLGLALHRGLLALGQLTVAGREGLHRLLLAPGEVSLALGEGVVLAGEGSAVGIELALGGSKVVGRLGRGGLAGGEGTLRVGQPALAGGQLARALGCGGVGLLAATGQVGLGGPEPFAVGGQLLRAPCELRARLLVTAAAFGERGPLELELRGGGLDALALRLDLLLLVRDAGKPLRAAR